MPKAQPTADALQPGDVLSGKYQLVKVLGRGGMGIVFLGTHTRLGHRVAIKTLLPEARVDQEACVRFEREARAAARLKSRFVARVTDVETLEDGSPYMVMEFLEGVTLGLEIEKLGRLSVGDAVDFTLQACTALQEAHSEGIVHRDIKPENLFLATDGPGRVVKVLDFGISKVIDGEDRRVTQTGLVLGTPMYMAPEQIRSSKSVDHRCDIWSMGVVLYEALTGRPPFDGENAASVIAAITADQPMAPHEWEADIPEELSRAVMKALAKWPDKRYRDVVEFAAAIQPFSASFEFALPAGTVRPPMSAPFVATDPTTESFALGGGVASTVATKDTVRSWTASTPASRKLPAVALAAGLVGIAALAGWKVLSGSAPGGPAGANAGEPGVPAAGDTVSIPLPRPDVASSASPSSVASAGASTAASASGAAPTPAGGDVPRVHGLGSATAPSGAPGGTPTAAPTSVSTTTPPRSPSHPTVAGDGLPMGI